MSFVYSSLVQYKKMLGNLDAWLNLGVAHAKAKSFDPDVLAQARLAPDQYPLARQVQSACDAAKFTVAHLAGKEAPKHPDTEATIAELQARIHTCVAYLDTLTEADFKGAEDRAIHLSFLGGKVIRGGDYLRELGTPNFYFHVVTAYSILRNNGVALGKQNYLGSLPLADA